MDLPRRLARRTRKELRRVRGTRRRPGSGTGPPQNRLPEATYARILDGETLWVAVSAVSAVDEGPSPSLALRNGRTGSLTVLDTTTEQHRDGRVVLSGRHVLYEPGGDPALRDGDRLDLLVVEGQGPASRPVRMPRKGPSAGPIRVPDTQDGRWRLSLRSGPDRKARVVCRRLTPTALVDSVRVVEGVVLLSCTLPDVTGPDLTGPDADGAGPDLRLVSEDGSMLMRVSLAVDGHRATAEVRPGDLRAATRAPSRLCVGTRGDTIPLRRRANALKHPTTSIPMPVIEVSGAGEKVRLMFAEDGSLAARRVGRGDDA